MWRLLAAPFWYATLVASHFLGRGKQGPIRVVQGVVIDGTRVVLTLRRTLRGWEIPGGNLRRDEDPTLGLVREIAEETGLRVHVDRLVGTYHRSGFMAHTAWVYRCSLLGEASDLRPSWETPKVAWFPVGAPPDTLFPWFRAPLEDALSDAREPVERREHLGAAMIWAGMKIDLQVRLGRAWPKKS